MRIFAGNQNDTVLATAVITELDALAFECASVGPAPVASLHCASHHGRGDSGTGRLGQRGTLAQLFPPPGKGSRPAHRPDDGKRVLTNLKANYGQPGNSIDLQMGEWPLPLHLAAAQGRRQGIGANDKAERVFLALLRLHNAQNINVSANSTANNYAPKVFSPCMTTSSVLSTGALARAMSGAAGKRPHRQRVIFHGMRTLFEG